MDFAIPFRGLCYGLCYSKMDFCQKKRTCKLNWELFFGLLKIIPSKKMVKYKSGIMLLKIKGGSKNGN